MPELRRVPVYHVDGADPVSWNDCTETGLGKYGMSLAGQEISEKTNLRIRKWLKPATQAWIAGAAILVATLLVYPVRQNPSHHLADSGFESLQLGTSLALKGSFSDPFFPLATGPSAHLAPAYPALVAAIIKLFGAGSEGDYALQWVSVIVLAAQLALFPLLAGRIGLSPWAGALGASAWLWARYPVLPWENDFAALLVVLLAFPMYRSLRTRLSPAQILCCGLLWGLLLLLTPTPLLVLAAWLAVLLLTGPQPRRYVILLAVIPLLVIAPWLVRNFRVFHRPVFLRDNLGIELGVSNNDCARFSMALNLGPDGCFSHPNASLKEALQVRDLGEPAYNHTRQQQTEQWVRQHPRRFMTLTAERLAAYWMPNATGNVIRRKTFYTGDWIIDFATLLSIPGLILMWRRNRQAATVFLLWLVFFPPIYYLIQFAPRYRHPVLWATFIPAAYVVVTLLPAAFHSVTLRVREAA